MSFDRFTLEKIRHVPLLDVTEERVCLNPGSVSIPKENSWHGYMTLEDGHFRWCDLEGHVHQVWDAN